MNTTEEKSENLRNFRFLKAADDRLKQLKADTGRDMTVILEDYLLGRRQFRPDIEKFIADEKDRTNRTREEIIEAALLAAKNGTKYDLPAISGNQQKIDAASRAAIEQTKTALNEAGEGSESGGNVRRKIVYKLRREVRKKNQEKRDQ